MYRCWSRNHHPVKTQQIICIQSARDGFEFECLHDGINTCLVQITQRAVKLLLCVEHIRIDARSNFEANFVGLHRIFTGFNCRLERIHLRLSVDNASKRLFNLTAGNALSSCQLFFGLLFKCQGFTNL